MAKAKSDGKKLTNGAAHRKRKYERTTPVGRVKKHLDKANRVVAFAISRLQSWAHSEDEKLLSSLSDAREAQSNLNSSLESIEVLFKKNWLPPAKITTVVYDVGDEVKINNRYRKKYLQAFSATIIDSLIVAKLLDTGELLVRHDGQTPFIVSKSHIEKRKHPTKGSSNHASAR